jgi:hypothetical protein
MLVCCISATITPITAFRKDWIFGQFLCSFAPFIAVNFAQNIPSISNHFRESAFVFPLSLLPPFPSIVSFSFFSQQERHFPMAKQ